jgi:hypothetical protein
MTTQTTSTLHTARKPGGADPGKGSVTHHLDQCLVCLGTMDADDGPLAMLLCDFRTRDGFCNKTMHVKCAGLTRVPDGAWFCRDCPQGYVLGSA